MVIEASWLLAHPCARTHVQAYTYTRRACAHAHVRTRALAPAPTPAALALAATDGWMFPGDIDNREGRRRDIGPVRHTNIREVAGQDDAQGQNSRPVPVLIESNKVVLAGWMAVVG